jgi:hypothetical protein
LTCLLPLFILCPPHLTMYLSHVSISAQAALFRLQPNYYSLISNWFPQLERANGNR